MSIIEKIKNDQLAARKERNTAVSSVLTTVLSECTMIGKNDGGRETTDAEVVAYLKKTIKNLTDFHNLTDDAIRKATLMIEIFTLQNYLPAQMTEVQIENIVNSLKQQGKGVPDIMRFFKENHAGMYDGAIVSKLAKG